MRSRVLPARSAGPLTTVNVTGKPELAVAVSVKEPLLLVRSGNAPKVRVWLIKLIVSASVVVELSLAPALLVALTVKGTPCPG